MRQKLSRQVFASWFRSQLLSTKTWKQSVTKISSSKALIGFLLLLGGAGYLASNHRPARSLPQDSSANEKTREPLRYPFEADGRLFIEIRTSSNPWWRHLCQKRGEDFVLIDSINQLRGHVKIRTGAQALSFVRLLTSAKTGPSFGFESSWEISAREETSPDLTYGDSSMAQFLKSNPDGFLGVVSNAWMASHHIARAAAEPNQQGWAVSRTCVRYDKGHKWIAVRMTEKVGVDGAYSRTEEEIKLPPPAGKGWNGFAPDD